MTIASTWILILIVQTADGVAIENVPDFESKYACEMAGYTVKQTQKEFGSFRWNAIKYSCVAKKL
jgi:hypothetical protein